jgi:hypothetical protein
VHADVQHGTGAPRREPIVPPSGILQMPCLTAFSTSGWMIIGGTRQSSACSLTSS